MSRIDADDVWLHHLGKVNSTECPCCGVRTIHRYAIGNRRDWDRGHIIPDKLYGPDILENVRPLCKACNVGDKKYVSNYHYMALKLGCIPVAEADLKVAAIWEIYDRQRKNLDMVQCLATVQSTGHGCTKSRKANSYFCAVHGKKAIQHFVRYEHQMRKQTVNALWEEYYEAGTNGDEERAEAIAELIYELLDPENNSS